MELLQNLSDDQTALIGCFVALVGAGLMMSLSYYLGKWGEAAAPSTHRLPERRNDQERPSKAA